MATSIVNRRDAFRDRFGVDTFNALVVIAKENADRKIPSRIANMRIKRTSLAAYRANLTRGAYKPFVSVTRSGNISDRLDLVNVR